jgi:predicted RNA methylase
MLLCDIYHILVFKSVKQLNFAFKTPANALWVYTYTFYIAATYFGVTPSLGPVLNILLNHIAAMGARGGAVG